MGRRGRHLIAIGLLTCTVILVLMTVMPRQPVTACGPFFSMPIFVSAYAPDPPHQSFAAGQLGHVRPTWARRYLVVAYRYLSGRPLSEAEQRIVWGSIRDLRDQETVPAKEAVERWLAARRTIVADAAPKIDLYARSSPGSFSFIVNCPADALVTAAATLSAQSKALGAANPEVIEWVRAQDLVFSNCSGRAAIPDPLPDSATVPARQNRAYQIAAARFYSPDFDAAEQAFRAIARDATSPWQHLAPYLAARCLIRKGTLTAGEGRFDRSLLEQAARELQALAKTAADARDRAMAEDLLGFVLIRTAPLERARQIGRAIEDGGLGVRLSQALVDYTWLLDRAHEERPFTDRSQLIADAQRAFDRLSGWRATSDLTDWIVTFQATGQAAADHALARWRESRSPAWLVAVLDKAASNTDDLAAAAKAAGEVPASSPAYPTVLYHVLRLQLARGEQAAVRATLDRFFGSPPAWPTSTLNELLATRMGLATSLDEFVRFASRVPAAEGDDYGAVQAVPRAGTDAWGRTTPPDIASRWQRAFDLDAAAVLNLRMPVSMLARVAASLDLTEALRDEVGRAAWTRAVLFEDDTAARTLFPFVERAVPNLKEDLGAYREARTVVARQRAGLFLLLKLPGLRPMVASGLGRDPSLFAMFHPVATQPLARIDPLRDNWWCGGGAFSGMSSYRGTPWYKPGSLPEPAWPAFLDDAARTLAGREVAMLQKLPTAAIVLCERTVAWGEAAPADPRIPEALYLAIRASHYGCEGMKTSASSGAAFRLLKSRYADTEWAKRTKYYY